ncbi:hypothetical protein GW17_00050856 [Ensete ventricosum]|nr:hypothetical protein GW17_00050856 [Ensete ventricosum]
MVPRREFAMRFAEGIGKLVGNKPGDRRKKTERLTARMPKVTRLAGGTTFPEIPTGKPPVSDSWTAHTLEATINDYQRLNPQVGG